MSWVSVGVAAGGAVLGYMGTQEAANAQQASSEEALALQRQQYLNSLAMLEPTRGLGYGAQQDLATLYGYGLPAYTPLSAMPGSPWSVGPTVGGAAGGAGGAVGGMTGIIDPAGIFSAGSSNETWRRINDPFNVFGKDQPKIYTTKEGLIYTDGRGGSDPRYAASINPTTGVVSVAGRPKDSELLTAYLRTGEVTPELQAIGAANGRTWKAIDELRGKGWTYSGQTTGSTGSTGNTPPTTPGVQGPGSMSRFFTSPDYQFRRDEGQRDIGNSFAARGGAASGNALRALADFNGKLASQEFGNYTERLMRMAGLGGAATNQAVNVGQNYGNAGAQLIQNQGDARASGIMGGVNSVTGALNNGLNLWAWQNAFKQPPAATPTPAYSNYGPWATGYKWGP